MRLRAERGLSPVSSPRDYGAERAKIESRQNRANRAKRRAAEKTLEKQRELGAQEKNVTANYQRNYYRSYQRKRRHYQRNPTFIDGAPGSPLFTHRRERPRLSRPYHSPPAPLSPGCCLGEAALSSLHTQGRARPPDAPQTFRSRPATAAASPREASCDHGAERVEIESRQNRANRA